jgi:hypothetical protein
MIPIYLLTNRKHHWLLQGFAYLFNQFWSPEQKVTVVSYGRNDLKLPENFAFHSIAKENYPAHQWSDGIIRFLTQINDDVFVTFLEDFWLNRLVDRQAVQFMFDWMKENSDGILRLELWRSVRSKRQARVWGQIRGIPIMQSVQGTKYRMNLQCNIWNRHQLMRVLMPGENPWQVEIRGTERVDQLGQTVLGVKEPLVNYEPIFQKGRLDHGSMQKIPKPDLVHITSRGWLKK